MNISPDVIGNLAATHYGLQVSVRELNGYDELNYLLTAVSGTMYICKIATEEHGRAFLDAQVKILGHLAASPVASGFQECLKNSDGEWITEVVIGQRHYYLRILTWLEGKFWIELSAFTDGLLCSLGAFLGGMDKALAGFSHPAMHRCYEWDVSTAADAEPGLVYIKDHERRRIASYFLLQFRMVVLPEIKNLRKAYIHGDANDYNVLVTSGKVSGLIDFGDMVYSSLVNNLAVACTYAMFSQDDVLHAASLVVKGYHENYPLTASELSLLYYLISARLCISVTRSAYQASLGSSNEHHFITEANAWELLFKLIEINPLRAEDRFRKACGFPTLIATEGDHSELEKKRNGLIGYNLSVGYKKHLKIVRGALQYLYDDRGNTYLDCVNNVSHVGHCHPQVVSAIHKQSAILNTNTRYLHDNLVEYAAKLTALLPPKLKVCYFTNSGSEANDLAIRISRHFTKQEDIIVLDHAYHGTSTLALEMSPYKFDGKGGTGRKPYIHKAMNPDLYRGAFRYGERDAGKKYADDVQRIIAGLQKEKKGPAAFICETLLGVGGQIPLPPGYLEEAYRHVRNAGGICIADEVQVGFGRVGSAFWGFQLQGVEPDIVVMGKPMGNGHPLAAVIITEELAEEFNNGMEYFNTYGGNPVSMAAGLSVLDVIEKEELQKNALETGTYLLEGLKSLMSRYPLIGDVRGEGLFIGVELVKDRESREPAVPEIDQVVEEMKNRGFLLSTDGPLHNVIKIKPPIIFSRKNANLLILNLGKVLGSLIPES